MLVTHEASTPHNWRGGRRGRGRVSESRRMILRSSMRPRGTLMWGVIGVLWWREDRRGGWISLKRANAGLRSLARDDWGHARLG